ncbi:MAG TPA: SH3 domain-containing protein [Gammaproteobacteria bacterium]|nr:SH3 domain-containing protein [Gammaproteobacteria bacterium]
MIANAGDVLYVMSKRAKILASPSFGSTTIQNLIKGEKLVSIEKNSNWYKVKYGDKTGWLSRLSVSYHPPMKRNRRTASVDRKLINNSRRRASSVSTTAAIRGLSHIDRSRVSSKDVMDFASLEKMEAFHLEDTEVFAFMDGIQD